MLTTYSAGRNELRINPILRINFVIWTRTIATAAIRMMITVAAMMPNLVKNSFIGLLNDRKIVLIK